MTIDHFSTIAALTVMAAGAAHENKKLRRDLSRRGDEKQLADWLLTNPETGAQLRFAGPLEREFLGLSRVRLVDEQGNEWTLRAGLIEGWLTEEQRAENIRRAMNEGEQA